MRDPVRNNVQILHSKATGYSVVADADDGMAIQIPCDSGEDAARLATILEGARYLSVWNKADLARHFASAEVIDPQVFVVVDARGAEWARYEYQALADTVVARNNADPALAARAPFHARPEAS